jgi:hypothetical protein
MSRRGKYASDDFVAPQTPVPAHSLTFRWYDLLGVPKTAHLQFDESPEERAFRRFPINSHKPGPT